MLIDEKWRRVALKWGLIFPRDGVNNREFALGVNNLLEEVKILYCCTDFSTAVLSLRKRVIRLYFASPHSAMYCLQSSEPNLSCF